MKSKGCRNVCLTMNKFITGPKCTLTIKGVAQDHGSTVDQLIHVQTLYISGCNAGLQTVLRAHLFTIQPLMQRCMVSMYQIINSITMILCYPLLVYIVGQQICSLGRHPYILLISYRNLLFVSFLDIKQNLEHIYLGVGCQKTSPI